MIKITVDAAVRQAVESKAKAMETELGHSSWGVDINAVLAVRCLRDMPALKSVGDYFKAPSKGGKLKSAEWSELLAILKVLGNAAAINGSLRGYGKKQGGTAAALVDDVG
jgi:hypothetical protein